MLEENIKKILKTKNFDFNKICEVVTNLYQNKKDFDVIVNVLNELGFTTQRGVQWTTPNLCKFIHRNLELKPRKPRKNKEITPKIETPNISYSNESYTRITDSNDNKIDIDNIFKEFSKNELYYLKIFKDLYIYIKNNPNKTIETSIHRWINNNTVRIQLELPIQNNDIKNKISNLTDRLSEISECVKELAQKVNKG